MQPLLYANLSKKTLSETQSGSSISWPRLVAGEDLVLKLRLVQSLDGQVIAARRTISTLKVSIGERACRATVELPRDFASGNTLGRFTCQ